MNFNAIAQNETYQNFINQRNKFAFDTYKHLFKFNQNEVYSPYFLTFQLGQLYLATKKGTAKQIATFAYFPFDKNLFSEQMKKYQALLPKENAINENFKYSVNLFIPDTLKYLKSYQEKCNTLLIDTVIPYPAPDKRATVKKINNVISQNTFFKIDKLLDTNQISDNPNLISVSASDFSGQWLYDFTNYTIKPFYIDSLGRSVKNVKYLYANMTVKYAESPDYQIVMLPYENQKYALVIVLPKKIIKPDTNLNFFNYDTYKMWEEKGLERQPVDIFIPEFTISSLYNLKPAFNKFMPASFIKGGNFTALVRKIVYLTDFYHYSKIGVKADKEVPELDKNYTIPPENNIFDANHPFLFFLISTEKHEVLTLGIYTNPIAKE